MSEDPAAAPRWQAEGLLFENCNCQLVCPAHISFRQRCTHERCVGNWAVHFSTGRFGAVPLDGLNAIVLWDSPQVMMSGGWRALFLVDETADQAQREAVERILSGDAGGPWAVIARFIETRLPTRYVPIEYADEGRTKRMTVEGMLRTEVEAIRGRNKTEEAFLGNMFNQIHAPVQVLAYGTTSCADGSFPLSMTGTHALYSRFQWESAL